MRALSVLVLAAGCGTTTTYVAPRTTTASTTHGPSTKAPGTTRATVTTGPRAPLAIRTTTTTAPTSSAAGFAAPSKLTGCVERGGLPDAACTPGAANPAVTQSTIATTICVSGWTATVRPPVSVTNRIKAERMLAYGLPGPPSLYELDHLVPLELGGATASVANLWPEPYAGTDGARAKDVVENRLKREVCSGTLALAVAQRDIARMWQTAP